MTKQSRESRDFQRKQAYIIRAITRQNEAHLGGIEIDLIDTSDYRDIFNSIKSDSSDISPETYLPRRFR